MKTVTVLQQGGGLLPEVEVYDDFHELHGPTGGWHPDDHAEFERILKACRGDYSHATLMCYDQMVGFKRADIIAHARYPSLILLWIGLRIVLTTKIPKEKEEEMQTLVREKESVKEIVEK